MGGGAVGLRGHRGIAVVVVALVQVWAAPGICFWVAERLLAKRRARPAGARGLLVGASVRHRGRLWRMLLRCRHGRRRGRGRGWFWFRRLGERDRWLGEVPLALVDAVERDVVALLREADQGKEHVELVPTEPCDVLVGLRHDLEDPGLRVARYPAAR